MARAATTTDAFNAIAEPRRRAIIDVLRDGRPQPVGEVIRRLHLPQPAVSKHLSVLRRVGIVTAHRQGRQRLYRLNARELKPVHDWAGAFEHFWSHHLKRIKERAEREASEQIHGPATTEEGNDDGKHRHADAGTGPRDARGAKDRRYRGAD